MTLHDLIIKFVDEKTKGFKGHEVDHAKRVYANGILIMSQYFKNTDEFDVQIFMCAALCHDVIDDKNDKINKEEARKELIDFLTKVTNAARANIVMDIIDNISYSKEVAGKLKELSYPYNLYRDAISDADKIDALNVDRCIEYTRMKGGKVPEDVIKHCHEKLLKLLPNGFIKTDIGKKMAEPHHKKLEEYVNSFNKQNTACI